MIGQILIHLLFGLCAGLTLAYWLALRGNTAMLGLARKLYYGFSAGVMIASVMLLVNVVSHSFEYSYVWNYSSKELPTHFLVASFYSGQEGSFMLWTMWVTLIGVLLLPYIKKNDYEAQVMPFFGLILCFLLLMLVAKNPFSYVWETFAKDGVAVGTIPPNGKGLNPLLHNIWITIHPPILFTGFASMSVPFVFAMAGLLKRDYQKWIEVAFPWALFATAVLGFGIMLGGFWAYETLGWGGFWAWDPVENSSLIPWLVSVALVHTMLVQRRTKGLVKTNIILATLCFVLVLYSTFLTRSGVLGDTSVHSFVDPGYFAFVLLIVFMLTFTSLGVGLTLWRMKDIARADEHFDLSSREFALSIGSSLVLASAIIVTLGTSYPIIAELIGKPKVAVDVNFYNISHSWLMLFVMAVNAVSLLMSWKRTSWSVIGKRSIIALSVSLVATIATYLLGVTSPMWLALVFCSWISLIVNLELAGKIIRVSPSKAGAYVSHTGIAFLMLGIIATAGYTQLTHARLVEGVPQELFGYKVTYNGKEQIEREYKDREKYQYFIQVEKGGKTTVAKPILYYSDFNKRQSAFLEPGISWSLTQDLYISPKATDKEGTAPTETLMKGEVATFPVDATMSLQLLRFDMSEAQNSEIEGSLKLATVVKIANGTDTTEKKLYSYFNPQSGEFTPIVVSLNNTTKKVALLKVKRNQQEPDKSTATFAFMDTTKPSTIPKDVFVVEVSVKPLITLVWFGVITMVAGFAISIIRHQNEMKRKEKKQTEVDEILTTPAPIDNSTLA